MKTANTPAPVASATGDKGLTATPSTRCLLPASAMMDALTQAKTERATTGKANAYAVLLEQFHRAILPAFFIECGGNLSEISRLLGIHRETVRTYAALADIDMFSGREPKPWETEQPDLFGDIEREACYHCDGTGRIEDPDDFPNLRTCPICDGSRYCINAEEKDADGESVWLNEDYQEVDPDAEQDYDDEEGEEVDE